jgi:hypothetical protein
MPRATSAFSSVFVVSTDGRLGTKEAKILLKKLAARLAEKWEKPYSEVCGYVNDRMSIVIVRATRLCLSVDLVVYYLLASLFVHLLQTVPPFQWI